MIPLYKRLKGEYMTGISILPLNDRLCRFFPRPHQPFEVIGRLIPLYDGNRWSATEQLFDFPRLKTYPNEPLDPADYIDSSEKSAFLAMSGDRCLGSITVCRRWNGNVSICDFEVEQGFRRCGIGTLLMNAAIRWGTENGLCGIFAETQDINLNACRFYLKYGFEIGGVDLSVYQNSFSGERAIYFYLYP